MSLTFTLTGKSSTLSVDYFPPIELDAGGEYEIGLLSFETYNSIPNVDETNNKFHYDDDGKVLIIPTGTYEVQDIRDFIQEKFQRISTKGKLYYLQLDTNNNTLQTKLKSTVQVDFSKPTSIGKLLGFGDIVIQPGTAYQSQHVVDIFKINTIRIECNIASGSYVNGKQAHTIFQFFPAVPPGYKLVEIPNPVIYLPVTSRVVTNITLRIVDQDDNLVNFRGERITVCLHLRKAH